MPRRQSLKRLLVMGLAVSAAIPHLVSGSRAGGLSMHDGPAASARGLVASALERAEAGEEPAQGASDVTAAAAERGGIAVSPPAVAATGAGRDGPILTSDDFFDELGDYYRSWSNDSNVSVSGLLGVPGGPQTWDFTSGPTDEIKRFDYVTTDDGDDPGAGFYAIDHFPGADFSQRMTEEIGGDQAWMYLDQITGVGRTNYGFYWPDGNGLTNDWSVFAPPILDFPDPMEWGDSWFLTTTYEFQMYDMGVIDVRIDLTVDADVDAWGTVVLPSLGPVEALRVNTEQTSVIYVWLAGQWLPAGTQYIRIYDWIGVDSDLIVEIGSVVSGTSMPPDDFTVASIFVRQFENSNPTAPPVIADIPDTTLFETYAEFTYDVEATGIPDPTFSLLAAPGGMTIDEVSGLIEWTPTSAQVGRDTVIVEADNGQGTDTEMFVATVVNLNEPPQNLTSELFDTGVTNLAWDAPASTYWLAGYNVYHSTSTGGPYALVEELGPYELSVALATQGFSQTNYYVVTAALEVGRGSYESVSSNEVLTYSLGAAEVACLNDDGTAESGHQAGGANGEMAASLDAPGEEEVTLTKVAVFLFEFVNTPITIKVSADDAGGYPGSSLAQAQYPESMLRGGWNILEIPEFMQPSFTGESFFVGVVEGMANNTVGLDEGSYGHSFTKAPGGAWSFMFSGELMLRAIVEDDGTGVEDPPEDSVRRLALGNFPDPFNPVTQIRYELPHPGRVTLRIHDLSGRLIRELVGRQAHGEGSYTVPWDGRDNAGRSVVSGTYFCRLEVDGATLTEKMILVK
jgi:hypothetical protein